MCGLISELKTLVAVARYGTFAAAGDRIGLTQSAVSGHMRRLEDHLGVTLFVRTGRSADLNETGRQVLAQAHDLLLQVDRLGKPVPATERVGRLRIGAIASSQPTIIKRALTAFHLSHPGYTMQVVPGVSLDLLDRIEGGDLDLAIIIRPDFGLPRRLQWTSLVNEPFVLAVPPDTVPDTASSGWREIVGTQPFLRYSRASFGGRLVDRLLEQNGVVVNDWVEIDDIPTLLLMVAEGLGVAVVPAAEAYGREMLNVRCVSIPDQKLSREIGIASRSAQLESAAVTFLEQCKAEALVDGVGTAPGFHISAT